MLPLLKQATYRTDIFATSAMHAANCGQYSSNLTGRICLSELHSQANCPEAPDAYFTSAHTMAKLGYQDPRQALGETSKLFNESRVNRRTFQSCKCAHVCSECKGRHSLTVERSISILIEEIIADNECGF